MAGGGGDPEKAMEDTKRAMELLFFAGESGHRFARQQLIAILEGRHAVVKINFTTPPPPDK